MASPSHAPATILFAHNGQDWIRGSERCLLDLVERIDRRRFRPVLWCDAPTLALAAQRRGVEVHLAPTTPADSGAFPVDRALARSARDMVQRTGARLIHANALGALPALVLAARSERIPVLAHLHLIPDDAERRWMLLHQVTLAVGVSRASLHGLLGDGMPVRRTRVIYNGVDGERLAQGSATGLRAQLGIAPGAFVVAVVASLIHRKGIDTVLRAAARVARQGRDLQLVVCGDGPDEPALRDLAATLDIAGRTHFLGERDDVGPILRDAADVLASAARLEAFPLNLLEGGECRLPVVVSDIAPHVEAVVDGVTGRIVPVDADDAFAAAFEELAADPALRERMGAAAQARVRGEFSFAAWIAHFERTFDELLARPTGELGWLRGSSWPPVYTGWVRASLGRRLARLAGAGRRSPR